MSHPTSDTLFQAVARLRELFSEWRSGQLMANLTTAAGCQQPEAIWDVEDDQLLAAAQRLMARNGHRQQSPAEPIAAASRGREDSSRP